MLFKWEGRTEIDKTSLSKKDDRRERVGTFYLINIRNKTNKKKRKNKKKHFNKLTDLWARRVYILFPISALMLHQPPLAELSTTYNAEVEVEITKELCTL